MGDVPTINKQQALYHFPGYCEPKIEKTLMVHQIEDANKHAPNHINIGE